MMELRKITLPQVMAVLAVLSLIGWAWAIADSDMPTGLALLLCGLAPVVLFVLGLYWVLEVWGLGDEKPEG